MRAPQSRNERPAPHPRTQNAPEHKVAGVNACRALFTVRPQDIRRVYVTAETLKVFGDVLKFCAGARIAYHIVTDADLDQVAETVHHDGVCFIARERTGMTSADLLALVERHRGPLTLVLLENVKNPHNLGAILRVCAHFGVRAVLAAGDTPALSPAVMRTAEGGAEHVPLVPVGAGTEILAVLAAHGVVAVATSSHTPDALTQSALPPRAVLMFGSEGAGLSRTLMGKAAVRVQIPGSGALESLNVACASSVLLWEMWRQHAPTPPRGKLPRG